ncbi:SMP-30/gluconolactonase/LRE family protein [Algisphaera agarilytica]|uniref:Sugar lactone lactonase YvrE n=1 Tax=Algisphaera agarilytica TaxID=1385975 RepID=A0A7X0LJX8_9BACT|nr:SMP-30/gluconolactonase/LRE family protein [Algisphaera agarilytica]MBB6429061.1 sugar lactone lactonase YvrE [Algisphaera agarilytica]
MKILPLVAVLAWFGVLSNAAADDTSIIPAGAVAEIVSDGGYKFTEGPALAPDGSIYFTDIPNNNIHRYDPETGETTLFTGDSGGANGLMFIGGYLYACAGKNRSVDIYTGGPKPDTPWQIDAPPATHQITHYGENRLNSPNDLAFSTDAIYFTDPRYGNRDGLELPSEAVFALTDSGVQEQYAVTRVVDNLVRPNGIGISPDFKTLYVADNGDKKIWAYPILEPGQVGEGWVLNDLGDYEKGPDGMTVDHLGRIYTTIYNEGVLILSPEGERLGFIETGPQTTNCVFGADGKTLYVTAEKSLKRVVLNTGK